MSWQLVSVGRPQFRITRHGKVVVITLSGRVDVTALLEIRTRITEQMEQAPTSKVLVDLRSAVLMLDRESFAILRAKGDSVPAVPVGLLVQPELLSFAHYYCQGIGDKQHARKAFTSGERGLLLARAWSGLPAGAFSAAPCEMRLAQLDTPRPPALLQGDA